MISDGSGMHADSIAINANDAEIARCRDGRDDKAGDGGRNVLQHQPCLGVAVFTRIPADSRVAIGIGTGLELSDK